MAKEAKMSSHDLDDTIRLFQGLIRIDTTNPPGNEGKAAEFLKEQFEKNNVECEVLGEPGRENAVGKIKGRREKPGLLFLSHTDVVPATNGLFFPLRIMLGILPTLALACRSLTVSGLYSSFFLALRSPSRPHKYVNYVLSVT